MKNIIFIISLMLCIFVENTNGKTKVIQVRKQTKTTKVINKGTEYLLSSQDLSITKLPIGFQGVNSIELYKRLEKRKDKLNKKEFETTSQFQDRIKKEYAKPIIGKLTEDSLYFFKVLLSKPILSDFDIISYNADNKEITVRNEISWTKGLLEESKPSVYLKKYSKSRKYLGSNAFGATAVVTEYQDYSYNLVISNLPAIQDSIGNEFVISKFQLDVNSVKQIKKHNLLGCVYIGKLLHPYSDNGFDSSSATIDSPT